MSAEFIAKAEVIIHAPRAKIWEALTDPELIKLYMFGATVETDWSIDGPISWKGDWEGRAYKDTGTVLRFEPEDTLQFTHAAGMSPDRVHTVTIGLGDQDENGETRVTLVQDGNNNIEEMEQSENNWRGMLEGLKMVVERED